MKKVIAIFAIAALTACGGASTTTTTDSIAVAVDSTVVTVDSTVAGGGSTAETLDTKSASEQTAVEGIK